MIHHYLSKQNTELVNLPDVIKEIENVIDEQPAHIRLAYMAFITMLESYQTQTLTNSMYIGDFKKLWYNMMYEPSENDEFPTSDGFMNLENKTWIN